MKVVIVGAGVAGLGIGWRLRQTGVDVTVLERNQPGSGATWAAAGMLAPTSESGEAETPETKFAHYANGLWPAFAAELEDKSGFDLGYEQCGSLVCISDLAEAAALKGHPGWLEPDAARAMESMLSPSILGALPLPEEAQVNNRVLGRALATAFLEAGGVLKTNEAVIRLEMAGGRVVTAVTPYARYDADLFVLAAGAWSGMLEGLPPDVLPPVVPVKGEMIALLPPEGAALPKHIIRSGHVYLLPRNGRLLVGATMQDAGFDTRLTREAEQWLFDEAVALLPDLARWLVDEHWAGLRPGSPDGLPILGVSTMDGLFIATGQFRNGILFAPAVAEVLSALVMGRAAPFDIAAFDPRRFARG